MLKLCKEVFRCSKKFKPVKCNCLTSGTTLIMSVGCLGLGGLIGVVGGGRIMPTLRLGLW